MEIRLLGPVEVWSAGDRLDAGPPQRRAVLAALAVDAGRPVPAETLIDRVWGDAPPARVRAAVHANVSLIRRILDEADGPAELAFQPGGYVLRLEPERVDLHRFRRLVASAGEEHPDGERAGLLRQALDLWRGPVMADLPGGWSARMRDSWGLERLDAAVAWARAELRMGCPERLIGPVRALVADYPLAEPLAAVLMRALAAAGRVAEALDCYAATRRRLADELGSEPGAELRDLHQELLRGDVDQAAPSEDPRPAPGAGAVPAQLPMDVPGFTGRDDEIARLDGILAAAGTEPTAVFISAIAGTAGVGKTALAVHWAHRVRDRFPDGQLYVNLRGYAPASPAHPIDALTGFLRALGVPADQVPTEEEHAAALYRSVLTGKRLLIVLDNAYSAEQVRPLLPGSPGCVVLVTSRDRLSGLVARDSACRLTLDVLGPAEARALLARLVGPDRVAAEPTAAAGLAQACAHLPLALRVAAAALIDDPGRSIAGYLAALTSGNRLDALAVGGDEHTAVRATFDLSYNALDPPERRLFRLLGLVPGPDFTVDVAAALAGVAVPAARPLLDRLATAHLVGQRAAGRYAFHDLLREYAGELSHRLDPEPERRAAIDRLLSHQLTSAYAAKDLLYPEKFALPRATDLGEPGEAIAFDDSAQALAWLDAERSNLVETIRYAAEHGPRPVAWRLADVLRVYFWLRMPMVDWLAAGRFALAAAQAEDDLPGQLTADLSIGDAYRCQGRIPQAIEHYVRAAALTRSGWPEAEAVIRANLGNAYRESGRLPEAADHYRQALRINQRAGRLTGQAINHANFGLVCQEQGRLAQAAEHHTQALALHQRAGSRIGAAIDLGNLGEAYHALGRLDSAGARLGTAINQLRDLGDRGSEAEFTQVLAQVHRDAGRYPQARETALAALSLARDLGERRYETDALNTLATVHHRLADHAAAAEQHRQALRLARAIETRYSEVVALVGLAAVHLARRESDRARGCAEQAATLAREGGYQVHEGQALAALAAVELDEGDAEEAIAHARQAVAIQSGTGHRLGHARALLTWGEAEERTAGRAAAVPRWKLALALFTDIGVPDAADVRALLDAE